MGDILLVDDDDQLRDSFYNLLAMEGHSVRAVASGEEALAALDVALPEVVIMDVRMSGMDGLTTLRRMREKDYRLPVIIMTAYSTTEAAIEATKQGAFDYILKPFNIPDILAILGQALEAGRMMRNKVALSEEAAFAVGDGLVGTSRAMNELYKAIGRVAPTDAVVLLRGESGTGKELVARALYQHSLRSGRPFLVVNCVAIPDTLLESELFGFEKGAFTGAFARRVGKVEQAGGGTLFLDEVGDMPVAIQAKLLRLLQERQIERIGGREPISVDVRIIAATNRDLEQAVASGRFREDLYYRLNVVTLTLPPLRERAEDIALLARHFLHNLAVKNEVPVPTFSPQALARLEGHPWPGNVRELKNLMQKLLIFNRGGNIEAVDVEMGLSGTTGTTGQTAPAGAVLEGDMLVNSLREHVKNVLKQSPGTNCFDSLMDSMAKVIIAEALEICNGNRSQVSRLLGLSRPTLLARMEKYGLQ